MRCLVGAVALVSEDVVILPAWVRSVAAGWRFAPELSEGLSVRRVGFRTTHRHWLWWSGGHAGKANFGGVGARPGQRQAEVIKEGACAVMSRLALRVASPVIVGIRLVFAESEVVADGCSDRAEAGCETFFFCC
jgi:hypothetical protein